MAINLVGFDSAWAGNTKTPGSISTLRRDESGVVFTAPSMVGFEEALEVIKALHRDDDLTLVAIDQPTIVPNQTSMRPAERLIAGTISWSGGGMQPAYRDKTPMFGDRAPIWRFLEGLGFIDDPEAVAGAKAGGFIMEVYPALALLSLEAGFSAAAKCGPRYNPARKTFKQKDWSAVCTAAQREATRLGLAEPALWCARLDRDTKPHKFLQDRFDALVCLLIAARWQAERGTCAMIGDLESGYVVAPVSSQIRARLEKAANDLKVAKGLDIAVA